MQSLTSHVKAGHDLAPAQTEQAVAALVSLDVADDVKKDFLVALRQKGETGAELGGFARALLERATPIDLDHSRLSGPTLDVCGTGGDRQGFFNVSTTVMFIAAAGGACVMKHGNRSVTSQVGAADVLEELGVKIDLSPAQLREALEKHGVAFIFAPAYHPAFKAIAPVRKALATEGHSTIFNLLGPLLNPARPDFQLVGVYSEALLDKYVEALDTLGRKRAWAVHGNGTDEFTVTGDSAARTVEDGIFGRFNVIPEYMGLKECPPEALRGGDRAENARILIDIVSGKEWGPKRDIALLNAGAALTVAGLADNIFDGMKISAAVIDSGDALAKLNALRSAF